MSIKQRNNETGNYIGIRIFIVMLCLFKFTLWILYNGSQKEFKETTKTQEILHFTNNEDSYGNFFLLFWGNVLECSKKKFNVKCLQVFRQYDKHMRGGKLTGIFFEL